MNSELKRFRLKALVLSLGMVAGGALAVAQDTPAPKDEKGALEWASMKERVDALEQKLSKSGPGMWPAWFDLQGEWELEYTDAQGDKGEDASANASPHFQHDKFDLKPDVKLTKNSLLHAEIQFTTAAARFEKGWYELKLPEDVYTRVGLLNRFTKADGKFDMADRKTEAYPLAGNSWWRDQHFGWEWGGKHKLNDAFALFWRFHLSDGMELSENHAYENDTWELTQDDDMATSSTKNKKELGFGLGFNAKPNDNWNFDVAGWWLQSNLNTDEQTRLAGRAGYLNLDPDVQGSALGMALINDEQHRWGVRTTHKFFKATTATFSWEGAQDGRWDRKAWWGQISHIVKFNKPLINEEFLTSLEPLVRFEEYRSDNLAPVYTDPETWDRANQVYALLIGISENQKLVTNLKLEYYCQDERTGAVDALHDDNIQNDEYLAQLEIKF